MDKALDVWVVDDDQSVRWVLEKALKQAGMDSRTFERGELLLDALDGGTPDVLITDVRMPGMDGLTLLERVSRISPNLPVIVVTAHTDLENAVAAYQGGAFEYLPKPFDVDEAIDLAVEALYEHNEDQVVEENTLNEIGRDRRVVYVWARMVHPKRRSGHGRSDGRHPR